MNRTSFASSCSTAASPVNTYLVHVTAFAFLCPLVIISFLHFRFSDNDSSSSSRNVIRLSNDKSQTPENIFAKPLIKAHPPIFESKFVPFFYVPPPLSTTDSVDPPFLELRKCLDSYYNAKDSALSAMLRAEDVARRSEWMIWPDGDSSEGDHDDEKGRLSFHIRKRIRSMAEILEADGFVLEEILQPFDIVYGLEAPLSSSSIPRTLHDSPEMHRKGKSGIQQFSNNNVFVTPESSSSYDSALQIITHIVRDWTKLGATIQTSLYRWCLEQLSLRNNHQTKISMRTSKQFLSPVLVPGAGLGRLAYDIARAGFSVEANEISIVMAAAAHMLLHNKTSGTLHPFAFDFLLNEVNSEQRLEEVSFPEREQGGGSWGCRPNIDATTNGGGSLSYTIGDFVQIYSSKSKKRMYGSIVTCFFIDTATNIYEYLLVVRNALRIGGIWVNVGPLQWHQHAKLHPSADELRKMMESLGFTIKHWSIDVEPINYRHDDELDSGTRYTKVEAYKPLRFVAILSNKTCGVIQDDDAMKTISNMRALASWRTGQTTNKGSGITSYEAAKNEERSDDLELVDQVFESNFDFVGQDGNVEFDGFIEEIN